MWVVQLWNPPLEMRLVVTPVGCKLNCSSWPMNAGGRGARGEERREDWRRRGEPQLGWVGGQGWGVKTTPGKQGVNKLCWQSNTADIHVCLRQRTGRVYYGTANEAAVSDFKVTWPRGEPRNYYFIRFNGNLHSRYLWLLAQPNEPKKPMNGSLFTSAIRFHRNRTWQRGYINVYVGSPSTPDPQFTISLPNMVRTNTEHISSPGLFCNL